MNFSTKHKIGLAIALLLFAFIKVVMLFWWQSTQPETANNMVARCDVAGAGCEFATGQRIQLIGVGNNKTPFAVRMMGLPENTQQVSVSFAMRDMEMGFNRFDLQKQDDGSWQAQPIYLPLCSSNRHDWQVKWQIDSKQYEADFQTQP